MLRGFSRKDFEAFAIQTKNKLENLSVSEVLNLQLKKKRESMTHVCVIEVNVCVRRRFKMLKLTFNLARRLH